MDRLRCEFHLVRYVADRVRGEFVTIGVLLREQVKEGGAVAVRFTKDWRRLRCMDPDVDLASLEATLAELTHRLGRPDEGSALLKQLEDSLSNSLQLTRAQGCEAENIAAEMDLLMRLYVEERKRPPVSRKQSSRQSIHDAMRREFERSGVWDFMDKKIPVTRYIAGADTLRIDCAYRNGGLRMFQAMPLEDIDAAKVLAFTAPALNRGVLERTGLDLELTAIGERLLRNGTDGTLQKDEEQLALYESGKRIMEGAGIRFLTTADLPRIAERAREELGI